MRWATILEGIDVGLDGVNGDSVGAGALAQKVGIVDSLSARQYLLSTHEHVIAVAVSAMDTRMIPL